MVTMMLHHEVPYFELHVRILTIGTTPVDFLRPAQSLILRSCSLHAPALARAVVRNSWLR